MVAECESVAESGCCRMHVVTVMHSSRVVRHEGRPEGATGHVGGHVGHSGAEVGGEGGESLVSEGLEKVVHGGSSPLLLLALRRHFPVSSLDSVFFHGQRSINL